MQEFFRRMQGSSVLTEMEAAVGMVFGLEPGIPTVAASRRPVMDALGDLLEPHLASGPVHVWLTGDDGGCIGLAAAVRRARGKGLSDPIPMTLITSQGAPDDEHVRAVVDALGLTEWLRVEAANRLGLLGADARAGLRRHGLRYPSVGHVVVPAAQAVDGGTIVDCHGLREVWDFWRWAPARRILAGQWLGMHATARAALALTPTPIWRRAVHRRLRTAGLDYARPEVSAWLRERWAEESATMPISSSAASRLLYRRRCLWETARTFSSLAEDQGAKLVHFFMDPGVVSALAGLSGVTGFPDSRALVAEIAPEIPARPSPPPGLPRDPFWEGHETQDFIRDWDGSGVDTSLVDPERLREAWLRKDSRSGLMLQSAWLESAGLPRGVESADAAVPAYPELDLPYQFKEMPVR